MVVCPGKCSCDVFRKGFGFRWLRVLGDLYMVGVELGCLKENLSGQVCISAELLRGGWVNMLEVAGNLDFDR